MYEISIIIPVYNVQKYLRHCLDSLYQQLRPDYEVILVNDGSTDESPAICREYNRNIQTRLSLIRKMLVCLLPGMPVSKSLKVIISIS